MHPKSLTENKASDFATGALPPAFFLISQHVHVAFSLHSFLRLKIMDTFIFLSSLHQNVSTRVAMLLKSQIYAEIFLSKISNYKRLKMCFYHPALVPDSGSLTRERNFD